MEFDWNKIFLSDLDWSFTFEIIFRTVLMFALILIMLRLSGKKGVRQLSIFEVAIIIALGSAAGDPMFNDEMAILPSVVVFAAVLLFYRLLTFLAAKSEKFEDILEGKAMYVMEDGLFTLQEQATNTFAKDEFFAEMREAGITHTGQVETAILESNGKVSFFYYEDDKVKYGMPVLPKPYAKKSNNIVSKSHYSCTYCGYTEERSQPGACLRCRHKQWVPSVNTKRVT
jgi:uncharacterized membrane protein YcaP (DUF421 family)